MSFISYLLSWKKLGAQNISVRNREKKWRIFLAHMQPQQTDHILDVGFSENEYAPGDNFLEKHYPFQQRIIALGMIQPSDFCRRYPQVSPVVYGGDKFPFKDGAFQIGWSNAVLEHVGSYEEQLLFLKEISRVCRSVFVSTPNRFFAFEVHTRIPLLHWLPKPLFDKILCCLGLSWASGNYMHLLSLRQLRKLIQHAGLENVMILKNRFLLFTLNFLVIIRKG
jgi:hypothetical protein